MDLKLYKVTYQTWDMYFSNLIDREMFSVGYNEEDAITKVKECIHYTDERNFEAEEVDQIFGYKISVGDALKQNMDIKDDIER